MSNRVSIELFYGADLLTNKPDFSDGAVVAYFDGNLISEGYASQFDQVVAFADKVARGKYELDKSPFGGYYTMSWDDLDEWYQELLAETTSREGDV